MDRIRFAGAWIFLGLPLALFVVGPAGCNWLSVAMYAINPNDIAAKFKGLEDKRVVVVCRPVVELQFADSTVPRDLMRQVSALVSKKVRKINLVDEREVAEWTDENNWHTFTEVGKALKADMVVGIDLEQFSLHQGPTLYQGAAALSFAVYDMQDGGRQVYSDSMPRVLFPPHTPIPAAEKSEVEFRRQFIAVLGEQIARHFYAHESRADFADNATMQ